MQKHKKLKYKTVVLFGGTGFIGSHLARYLLEKGLAESCVLADIQPLRHEILPVGIRGRISSQQVDVREPIPADDLPSEPDLIVNLAAVHREPGHEPEEYFATNLPGAENVCAYARKTGCPNIIFTSSIAPYGPGDEPKDESSLPVPQTPYGASKLVAEKIHLGWQQADNRRRLLMVRPGVVFGPGEGGNVTRMIRSVLGRYFVYMGNRDVRKAGGYIKDLCHAMCWTMERMQEQGKSSELFNFSLDPPPSVLEYVQAICRVAGVKRFVPSVPYPAVMALAGAVSACTRPLGISQPLHPVRVRKLVRHNWIEPVYLRDNNYPWQFSLQEALGDWREECPEDWGPPAGRRSD